MQIKQNVIQSLINQNSAIENLVQKEGLQLIGDQSYGQLNDSEYNKKKTQIILLKDQQYIDAEQLKRLEEHNEDQLNQQQKWIILLLFKIIRPEEPKKIIWDLIGMSFIFIQMITIPLILTFSFEISGGFAIFNDIMDYYFLIDILLQFQTGYYEGGYFVSQRRQIALNYLKLWFWLDLISSFPYDDMLSLFIDESNSQSLKRNTQIIKIMRIVRFIKVIRLMRALKLKKIINQIEDTLFQDKTIISIISFFKICLIILSLSHWLACIWNAIRFIEETDNNWYTQYVINFDQEKDNDPDFWFNQYVAGIYFSITTMITIGYGDISPKNTIERSFGIFVMILASGVFGYVMNSIVLLFQNMNESLEDLLNKNTAAIKYMKQKEVNKKLQSRIKNYLEWLIEDEQLQKSYAHDTLEKLSLPLKNQLTQIVHGKMMNQIKFLSKNFSSLLLKNLAFTFQEEIYNPEDWIINQNDPINDQTSIYFILNGRVSVCFPKSKGVIELIELSKKQYFGEISFFGNIPRCASVKARNFINLFRLSRKSFLEQCEIEDIEKFFQLKFKIEFEQDYEDLNLFCYVCQAANHTAKNCPNVHYVINKYDRITIIEKYNEEIKLFINERRRQRKKCNTLKYLNNKRNQQVIQQITEEAYHIEKYINFHQTKPSVLTIKDSFRTDSIKEYTNFTPNSNLNSIARLQNYNAELYAENVRQQKELMKKNKLKSKFVQLFQNKKEQRQSLSNQSGNKFSKLVMNLTKLKKQQDQQQQQNQEQENSQIQISRLSSPSTIKPKLLRAPTMVARKLNEGKNTRLQRLPRKTYLGQICGFEKRNQQFIDIIMEDSMECSAQPLKQSSVIKIKKKKTIILQKSTESTIIESNQFPDVYFHKQLKRSQSSEQLQSNSDLEKYSKLFLEDMIYLVVNYKLQNCK
ncbi:unnamed protein product [Paramecium primaurelia]|uniref:Cyclic nucleotide-binding domain-containing protein n=1 Tax=Paramecium primaurelia TaxID=5886 RepID=A0A8S1NHS8_PARPR|nr:unnamed protein product [Paramecium primaurelia]